MVVGTGGGEIFILLPRVLRERGASVGDRRVADLDLLAIGRTLERVRAERGGEPFKTILPIEGRLLSNGTTFEQALEESPPYLPDLGLAEPFLPGTGMFITFTFFSQPVG